MIGITASRAQGPNLIFIGNCYTIRALVDTTFNE